MIENNTMTNMDCESNVLLCTEIMEPEHKTPESKKTNNNNTFKYNEYNQPQLPAAVNAIEDKGQVDDDRILQNLLRNEEKYMPVVPDFLNTVQKSAILPSMRKIVIEWMLEVIQEQNQLPETFSLAVNILDRFLSRLAIHKSQLQLVGSVAILIASKIKSPYPILGKSLVIYTADSISEEELRDWELLVLYELQWEMTGITSSDYLDHVLPRLGLENILTEESECAEASVELRRRTDTILTVASTEYAFASLRPSLVAASAVMASLQSLSPKFTPTIYRELRLRLQTVTHAPTSHMQSCMQELISVLPDFMKDRLALPLQQQQQIKKEADSTTTSNVVEESTTILPELSYQQNSNPASPDLVCKEVVFPLTEEGCFSEEDSLLSNPPTSQKAFEEIQNSSQTLRKRYTSEYGSESEASSSSSLSRSSSPLSAVDIFSEFDTNVLQKSYPEETYGNMMVTSMI